jgi:hypothetical protein
MAPLVKPEAWDHLLANAPESENVEDRRDLDAIDMDEIYWRRASSNSRGQKRARTQNRPRPIGTVARVRFSVCTADNRVRASISSTRRALDRLNALGVAKNVVGVVLRLDLP